ncbi:unnamed protein product [Adineta ricciae]|uniref:Uncharacterized protein n=1 Tax=Adineta ricciae TaxID=249248 RepID=A0A814SZR4_ADIRI|nr:unnamed protein product [Adineta ricciae]CAF1386448.1 unnamed protein product [Adineta ricciae]
MVSKGNIRIDFWNGYTEQLPVTLLLLGMPFEQLKLGLRQKSISQTKHKLADHILEEKEGSARDVRRRCAGCYEKISQLQWSEVGPAAEKKVKNFCPDYFNQKHLIF